MQRTLIVLLLAIALLAVLAVPALAAAPANGGAGQLFGQHQATMAQSGQLGQDMNPGMHQGISGWTPMP
jgi:hypothetical protein